MVCNLLVSNTARSIEKGINTSPQRRADQSNCSGTNKHNVFHRRNISKESEKKLERQKFYDNASRNAPQQHTDIFVRLQSHRRDASDERNDHQSRSEWYDQETLQ